MANPITSARAGMLGGLLLWFAALGGALAWAVHLIAAWSIDELTCAAGRNELAGVPLRLAIGLAIGIPALVTAAALAASWTAWRGSSRRITGGADRSLGRVRMMAIVGLWSNLLFLSIIVLGGAAALVLPPCQR